MNNAGNIRAGGLLERADRERETQSELIWLAGDIPALEDSLVVTRSVECLKCETRIKCSAVCIAWKDVYLQQHNLANTDKKKKKKERRCSDTRASSKRKGLSLINHLKLHV